MKSLFYFLKTGIPAVILFTAFNSPETAAQTIAAAQSIPYTQDFSAWAWNSTTYPAGWQGWSLDNSTGSTSNFRTTAPISDKALSASGDASSVSGGVYNYNGKIGFLAQNNGNKIDPALALSISTMGQSNIKVVFDVMTIRNPYGGSQSHINNVELQYRIGSLNGPFTSLSGSIYANNSTNQTSGTSPQHLVSVSATLPVGCENQSIVQLRWVQRDSTGSGTHRPSFALDNVSICGVPSVVADGATTFCGGNSVTLTASNGNSYLWSNGQTTQSIIVSSSGNYNVSVTQTGGCSNTSESTVVTVNALPVVSATSDEICQGESATITASGASSYSWHTGETAATLNVSPSSTTNYTVTGTDINSCTNTAIGTITVNSLPIVSSTSETVCQGLSATIVASGASSYSWNTGETTSSITLTPSSTTIYTVEGTSSNGCTNIATGTITVNSLPNVSVPSISICKGSSVTITANGAVSYSWNTGATEESINVNPPSTTAYIVDGTDANGCMNSAMGIVTVNPVPEVTILSDPDPAVICATTNITLSGVGASTYSWSGGISDGIPFSPVAGTTYTVIGTDTNGCSNTAQIDVTVINDCPVSIVPCGISFTTFDAQKNCISVPGAVSYRFKFYDATGTNLVATQTQASNYINFSQVNGLMYGTTYLWTVEVGTNTESGIVFGPPSSLSCPITFNAPVSTVPCGNSFTTFDTQKNCISVPGAVSYRFKFYDATGTNLVATRTQASNYINFSKVRGLIYGNTYMWTVEVEYNTGSGTAFGPPSNLSCPITFNAPVSTVPCGNSFTTFDTQKNCIAVPGAVNYRFKFYDVTGTNLIATRTQASNYINFSKVTGLIYGNTYMWTVEVEYNTGSGTAFGPPSNLSCPITFNAPVSTIPCGNSFTTFDTQKNCISVPGAVNYRFKFYDVTGTNLIATRTQASNYINFSKVTGLMYGNTYMWTVEVEYSTDSGTAFGPPSNLSCPITFNAPASTIPCGISFTTFDTQKNCIEVPGAINYRFKFYDTTGINLIATVTQASNYINFSQVAGLMYGNTYMWTVEVEYSTGSGTAFGPPSNLSCPITFNAPVSTVPCGNSFTTFDTQKNCIAVPGAVNYRFKFYDTTGTNLIATVTQASNYINFSKVAGLMYGNTYMWTVEVEYSTGSGTAFGPPSSLSCPVTFIAPVSTVPCGNSFTTFDTQKNCIAVPGAVNYRFKFYDTTGINLIATVTQASNYINFSQVAGLMYGNTYMWTVEVEYNTGSGTAFGPPSSLSCPITFSVPVSTVPCCITLASLNTYQVCAQVPGAINYKFTFYSCGTNTVVACKTQASRYIYFDQVIGLVNNQTYDWTVAVEYFNGTSNVFGPESTPCSITFGSIGAGSKLSGIANGPITGDESIEGEATENNSELDISVYPNPTKGDFSIEISRSAEIAVYNLLGEKVYECVVEAGKQEFSLGYLSSGIYIIQIHNGVMRKQIRLVKE